MRMLSHDALIQSVRIMELVQTVAADFRAGNEAQGRARLQRADSLITAEMPIIREVLAAQTKAAEHMDRAQWTPQGRIPLRPRPKPQLHAANDEHGVTPSEQPGPTVA
jgi:hypothetical protein